MKRIIKTILIAVILSVSLKLAYSLLPKKIAVLTYHDFTTGEPTWNMQKNIKEFEKEMKYLKDHNYKTLTLKEVECYLEKKCNLPRKSVLITMDDGWKSELELALPVLKKYDLNATIFYIGINYDEPAEKFLNQEDIKNIKENYKNIEIASHTYNNHIPEGYQKSKEEIKEDLEKKIKEINTKYFAYPYGKYSDEYIEALKEEGYKLAFTFGPDKEHRKFTKDDDPYKIPRYNVSTTYSFYKFVLRLALPF